MGIQITRYMRKGKGDCFWLLNSWTEAFHTNFIFPARKKIFFKIHDVTPGQQIIPINKLPNISRSKGNQAMKYGKLIEDNKKNIFLEKSFTKCCGETILRLFS